MSPDDPVDIFGVDDDDDAPDGDHAPERPVDKLRRTAVGSVVAAGLLGLRDALEGRPEKEEIAIVSEAPDEPVDDDDALLTFDEALPPGIKVVVPRLPDDDRT